ncbi:chaplin [Streptomyces alboniger]|nr:chaplin [Streptomyces alboniger]
MLSAAAATSILSLSGTAAFADSEASGQASGSPGVLSGNSVQAPLEVPVNVCGNSVNGVAALNPATGNKCATTPSSAGHRHDSSRTARSSSTAQGRHDSAGHSSGAAARGDVTNSPGALSGNSVKAPVSVPVNVCGNTVDGVAAASPAMSNHCGGQSPEPPAVRPPFVPERPGHRPGEHEPQDPGAGPAPVPPGHAPQSPRADNPAHPAYAADAADAANAQTGLAETGMDGALLGTAAASTGLLLGGAILYRRGRTAPGRR